jgi:hypothetical protein
MEGRGGGKAQGVADPQKTQLSMPSLMAQSTIGHQRVVKLAPGLETIATVLEPQSQEKQEFIQSMKLNSEFILHLHMHT